MFFEHWKHLGEIFIFGLKSILQTQKQKQTYKPNFYHTIYSPNVDPNISPMLRVKMEHIPGTNSNQEI